MSGVILLGGGLDSTALLLHLRQQRESLYGIHFQYGQRADRCEFKAVQYWCRKLLVPLKTFAFPLDEIAESAILRKSHPSSNRLEGRNVIFTMLAATYAATIGAEDIYLGFHSEPVDAPFPDATMRTAIAMQEVLKIAYKRKLIVSTPFAHMSRTRILRKGYELDEEILTHTHTCYEDVEGGCGQCVHCKQRMTMINALLSEDQTADPTLEENA